MRGETVAAEGDVEVTLEAEAEPQPVEVGAEDEPLFRGDARVTLDHSPDGDLDTAITDRRVDEQGMPSAPPASADGHPGFGSRILRRLFTAVLGDGAHLPADRDGRLAEASYAEVHVTPAAQDADAGAPAHCSDTTDLGLEALLAAAAEFPIGQAADDESAPTAPVRVEAEGDVEVRSPGVTEPEAEQEPLSVAVPEPEPVFATKTEAELEPPAAVAEVEPERVADVEAEPPLAVGAGVRPSASVATERLAAIVALILLCGVVVVTIGSIADDGTVPVGGQLLATASPGLATPSVTMGKSTSGAAFEDSPSPRNPSSTPGSDAIPTATAETRDRVALRTETLVARAWRDSAGTVRVHVVVSATNDTTDFRSLIVAERTFQLISPAGRTLHTGRFPYAFPFVIPPGGTSHLITTAVLPVGVDGTNLRVESELIADITTAAQPMLEVGDLRLVSSGGRPGVRGIVRNTGAEEVTFGVVAVIGRDASGRVIGGLYDNVNVASIAAGGEATFQTEYPGLPPAAARRIADLSGVAFDVGTSPP